MFMLVKSTEYGAETPILAYSEEAATECLRKNFIEECVDILGIEEFCEENCYDPKTDECEYIDDYQTLKEKGLVDKAIKYFVDSFDAEFHDSSFLIYWGDNSFLKMAIFDSEKSTVFVL
jgi:hypothetical protein